MSSNSNRTSSIALLLLVLLTLPTAGLAQNAKASHKKVPTPNGPAPSELIYAVTSTNVLVSFNSQTPGSISSSVAITGLQGGESVLGIDFRPATRQLYALGSTSRLYTVNLSTGVATVVGTQFTTLLNGTAFGFDFNPTVDRIRVTSEANQNMRLNPNNGTIAAVDVNLAYGPGDPNIGLDPNVVGSAYTNNFAGATTTTLYDFDSNLDILALQTNPNGGVLNTVGPLGFNTNDLVGFDISRLTGVAYASLTAPAAATSGLFTINLANGAATLIGTIGGGVTIRDISVVPVAQAGDLIISEFRLRGPAGPNDEFVEIYNASPAAQTVVTFDGSSGFAVAASDGIVRFVIPNGTVIPQGGHYLGVNSAAGGYSLGGYPAGDATTATGDATYTTEIPDNIGIALFNTSNAGNLNTLTRLDAVGPNTELNVIYKEGTGYPPVITTTLNYSFFRNLRSGLPQDTNNNFASATAEPPSETPTNDFVYADTAAIITAAGQRLGAPGPENLSSPIQRSSTIKASLIAPCVSSTSAPNRVRTGSGNSGTLELRRKFTNNSGLSVTRLRFRIVDITGFPFIGGFADLRAVTSTTVSIIEPCSATTIPLNGLTLETPPAQPFGGGGFNSTLSAGTVTAATPIAPGASINVNFLLNIAQAGTFRFFVTVEALP